MTIPIHSVKHEKAQYIRFQILAIASAAITIIAVLLAAITSFHLASLSKDRIRSAASQQNVSNTALNAELTTLKEKLATAEQQLDAEKSTVKTLETKSAELQNKLNTIKKQAVEPGPDQKPKIETPQETAPAAPETTTPAVVPVLPEPKPQVEATPQPIVNTPKSGEQAPAVTSSPPTSQPPPAQVPGKESTEQPKPQKPESKIEDTPVKENSSNHPQQSGDVIQKTES